MNNSSQTGFEIKDLVARLRDILTQKLLQGLFILLDTYPQAKIRMGYDIGLITVREVDNNLHQEDKELLESYDWQLVYYEDKYFWEFELQ